MQQHQINIALTIQENFKIPALVLINSIVKSNANNKLKIYILCDVPLNGYFLEFNSPTVDIQEVLIDIDVVKNLDCGRFGVGTLFRLLLDKYIPNELEKLLYLDSDVIVNSDLKELYSLNFNSGELVAGVACSISKSHVLSLGLQGHQIFNAGVILFDFKMCCKNNIFEKCIEYVTNNNTAFNDQDALNVVLKNNVKFVSEKWNYEFFRAKKDLFSGNINPDGKCIIHYTGRYKPWDYADINPYSYLYLQNYEDVFHKPLAFNNPSITTKISKKVKLFIYKNRYFSKLYAFMQRRFRTDS